MADIPNNSKEELNNKAPWLSTERYSLAYGNARIKELLGYYVSSYKQLKDAAKERFIKSMMADGMKGARIPDDIPLTDEIKDEWFDIVETIRNEINGIIELRFNTLKKAMTDAPSTEALNSIMLLNMRKNVTEQDVTALIERYGNNPQCYYALRDIAQQHEVYWQGSNGIIEQYENLKIFEENIQKISANNVLSDGLMSLYKQKANEIFSEENAIRTTDTVESE